MAERLGFEPRKELPLCRFSRPVLSTAQPSLRKQGFISKILKFNKKENLLFLNSNFSSILIMVILHNSMHKNFIYLFLLNCIHF